MLQFITVASERFTAEKQAELAIAGGCRWIQLGAESVGDSETGMKDVARSLMPMCEKDDAFLVLEDDVELVDELKVHGVFMRDGSRETVAGAREHLGAHAVVGAFCRDYDDVAALKGVDVDYVAVPLAEGAEAADFYREMRKKMIGNGIDMHLVALGDFAVDQLGSLLEAGCAGVATGHAIADAYDPEGETRVIIEALNRGREAADVKRV